MHSRCFLRAASSSAWLYLFLPLVHSLHHESRLLESIGLFIILTWFNIKGIYGKINSDGRILSLLSTMQFTFNTVIPCDWELLWHKGKTVTKISYEKKSIHIGLGFLRRRLYMVGEFNNNLTWRIIIFFSWVLYMQ